MPQVLTECPGAGEVLFEGSRANPLEHRKLAVKEIEGFFVGHCKGKNDERGQKKSGTRIRYRLFHCVHV
jgi:hypothetical protein